MVTAEWAFLARLRRDREADRDRRDGTALLSFLLLLFLPRLLIGMPLATAWMSSREMSYSDKGEQRRVLLRPRDAAVELTGDAMN